MDRWIGVLVASLGCAALKLSGFALPTRWLDAPRLRRVTELIPVALLSALVAVSTFASGHRVVLESRAAGLVVAALLAWRRLPFLVIVVVACASAAAVHALHH